MTAAVESTPAKPGRASGTIGRVAMALAVVVVLAHGCHGDDVDHEPAVTFPARDDLPPTS